MEKGNRQVVVSALQFACTDDVPTNLATAERLVRASHAKGANIILIQELAAAQHELQILHAQIGAVTSEREQQMRSLTDKIVKMEAELQAAEPAGTL
ncbi:hypothetical protein GOBAR_DD13651 [Gossypium barbadense]|nr:hypothetical protein GOBAR_DD13651 [Gossypium barbadense]